MKNIIFFIIICLTIIAFVFSGCEEECKIGDIRCDNTVMEVCTKNGWDTMIDCKEYGSNFICVDHQDDIEGEIYCDEIKI